MSLLQIFSQLNHFKVKLLLQPPSDYFTLKQLSFCFENLIQQNQVVSGPHRQILRMLSETQSMFLVILDYNNVN